MSTHDVVAELFSAYNRHDAAGVGQLYACDGVHEDVGPGAVKRGPTEIADGLSRLFTAFPDCRWAIQAPIVQEGRAAVPYTFSATLGAPFAGVEPNGQTVELRGVHVIDVTGSRVECTADYWDVSAFMRQLHEPQGSPS
jgi:steroid delta-isomerase-like uncharacterized protein